MITRNTNIHRKRNLKVQTLNILVMLGREVNGRPCFNLRGSCSWVFTIIWAGKTTEHTTRGNSFLGAEQYPHLRQEIFSFRASQLIFG